MENKQALLDEYIKFNILNENHKQPIIKILVSYIKPSFLFKSEILTPIHLGRAIAKESSKDGKISDNDIKWLYKNCIGDDGFKENISDVNRRVGFLTGTFWAWKNYEKLGNPEFFGSFGYRKLFNPEVLYKLSDYDIIIPEARNLKSTTNKENFINWHGKNLFKSMYLNFQKVHPELIFEFDNYLNLSYGYYHEIYILKKQLFFDFCEWIFPLLFSCLADKNCRKIKENDKIEAQNFMYKNDKRDIAFIAEMYCGFYLYLLTQNENLAYREIDLIELEIENEKALFAKNFAQFIRNKKFKKDN